MSQQKNITGRNPEKSEEPKYVPTYLQPDRPKYPLGYQKTQLRKTRHRRMRDPMEASLCPKCGPYCDGSHSTETKRKHVVNDAGNIRRPSRFSTSKSPL